jgi:uncharacterized protein
MNSAGKELWMTQGATKRLSIGVVGGGISGLSAAWLLSQNHDVTLFEKAGRLGGHSNTVEIATDHGRVPVDTGFIVYNTVNYTNLVALFQHLDVATKSSNMSFAVSLGDGAFEYAGNSVASLFAQKLNVLRPRFWSMLGGILRFYRQAQHDLSRLDDPDMTLGDYLRRGRFGKAFERDHLLPMAGAIWSAPPEALLAYPAASFINFFVNHGLLKLYGRPQWRTVVGGSRAYVTKLARKIAGSIRLDDAAARVERTENGVSVRDASGALNEFDEVVIATHADQALSLLADPSPQERTLLGAFRYTRNLALLHSDASLMPKRKAVWSSWNYLGGRKNEASDLCVTYWMNRLQGIGGPRNYFVTLNPHRWPAPGTLLTGEVYEHPVFDLAALRAQPALPSLQGKRNTWFCGAYFGAGFHEDGLVSGLAVAEALGGEHRPWHAERTAPPRPPRMVPQHHAEPVP